LVGAVAPDFSNQIHDFNPGIAESGLFWTIPVPDDMVRVDLGAGTAEMHAEGIEVLDQYSFASALSGGPQEPATVSFDIWWHTPTAVEQLRDETLGFAATLLDVTSTIAFTARTANFEFVSDPPESGTSLFARIGFDANGVFLPPASAPGQATPTS
jgi:hypothetical protein